MNRVAGAHQQILLTLGLAVLLVFVAAISLPLVLLLLGGGLFGMTATTLFLRPPSPARSVALTGLALLVLGAGLFFLVRAQSNTSVEEGGPFVTAYAQEVLLDADAVEVEERYLIEADPNVIIERVAVEGEGTLQAEGGAEVDGMTIVPNGPTVAFSVFRPSAPVTRTPLGFRAWQVALPVLRATVVFRQPGESQPLEWSVVRCRDLTFFLRLQLAEGRVLTGIPEPDRITGNFAEWRSFDAFDRTDTRPEVIAQVDQAPALLRELRGGGQAMLTEFSEQLLATLAGTIVGTLIVPAVQKQWRRIQKDRTSTART